MDTPAEVRTVVDAFKTMTADEQAVFLRLSPLPDAMKHELAQFRLFTLFFNDTTRHLKESKARLRAFTRQVAA